MLLYNSRLRKFISYNFKGKIISSNRLGTYYGGNMSFIGGNAVALFNNYNGLVEDDRHNLFILDFDKKSTKRFLPYTKDYDSGRMGIGKNDYFWTSNVTDVNLLRFYDNIVYKLKKDSIVTSYNIDFGKYNLPEGTKLTDHKHPNGRFKYPDKFVFDISQFFETENNITFNYRYNKKSVSVFYNKKNKTFVFPRNRLFFNKPTLDRVFFHSYIYGAYDNYFICHLSADFILSFLKNHPTYYLTKKDSVKFSLLPGVKELQELKELDNPVLFFYKLK